MRRGFRIGLSLLAALSVMAVTAVAAQAADELRTSGSGVLAEGVNAELEGSAGAGKLLVTGLALTVECTGATLTGSASNLKIGTEKMVHGKVQILYNGCKVEGNKFCKVYETEADRAAKTNAEHIKATALVLAKLLSGGRAYLVASPLVAGGNYTEIFFTKGEGCTLTANNPVSGNAAFKVKNANTEEVSHGVEDITALEETELGVALKFGNEPSVLDEGNGSGKLIGGFLNQKFSLN